MTDRNQIAHAIETHCRTLTEGDREGWLGIWAGDAVLEDPVGVDTFRGVEALRSNFWALVELTSPMRLELQDDIIVCGNEAISILSAESSWEGTTRDVGPLVDHFTFGPDGKISSMRAFWNFARHGYRPEMAPDAASRERIVAAIESACRAENARDKESWLNLLAEDAVIEDPVGVSTFRGIEAIATDFWSGVEKARPRVRLTDEVIVCGNEAVARLSAEIDRDGRTLALSPIVVIYVFDEAGKIQQLRSFFNYS